MPSRYKLLMLVPARAVVDMTDNELPATCKFLRLEQPENTELPTDVAELPIVHAVKLVHD